MPTVVIRETTPGAAEGAAPGSGIAGENSVDDGATANVLPIYSVSWAGRASREYIVGEKTLLRLGLSRDDGKPVDVLTAAKISIDGGELVGMTLESATAQLIQYVQILVTMNIEGSFVVTALVTTADEEITGASVEIRVVAAGSIS